MPYPTANPSYTSSDWSVITPISSPNLSSPISGVATAYILKQKFSQNANDFEATARNTPYTEYFPGADDSEYEDFLLMDESERVDVGAGAVEWEATFAAVPATHRKPSTVLYEFPGFYGVWYPPNVTDGAVGRDPFQKVVVAEIQFDYFLLEEGMEISDIPIEQEQKYEVNAAGSNIFTRYLADAGFVTSPTRSEYEAMIANATEIVSAPSQIGFWNGFGTIIERQTPYIKPQ